MAGEERAEAYWGAHAREYDEFIVRVVPRYAEMMDRLLDYLPTTADRVLELGTGTGNLSVRLVERWPHARFLFVDGAPEMLDVTRRRIEDVSRDVAERSTFEAVRFEDLRLPPASVDLMIASLSLHHVLHVGAVYQCIAPALAPGGRLVMLDGLAGETEAEHRVHMERWQAYWHTHMSADEIRDMTEHVQQHDHYRSLSEHYELLTAAGFAYVDCVWRDGIFTLVTAAR